MKSINLYNEIFYWHNYLSEFLICFDGSFGDKFFEHLEKHSTLDNFTYSSNDLEQVKVLLPMEHLDQIGKADLKEWDPSESQICFDSSENKAIQPPVAAVPVNNSKNYADYCTYFCVFIIGACSTLIFQSLKKQYDF